MVLSEHESLQEFPGRSDLSNILNDSFRGVRMAEWSKARDSRGSLNILLNT